MEKKYIDMREWLMLTQEQRMKLADIFHVPRSGHVHVGTGVTADVIISDGRSVTDLEAISVETMQKYLGSAEKDFYTLFKHVIWKMDQPVGEEKVVEKEKVVPPIAEVEMVATEEPIITKKKNAKATKKEE